MFMDQFLKSRDETNNKTPQVVPFVITVQVGNSESIKEIEDIEKHFLFSHWEQPEIVKLFKCALIK